MAVSGNDKENCLKLMTLLIDEGTACLRKVFMNHIQHHLHWNGNLQNVLMYERNNLEMNRFITHPMLLLLYPTNGQSDPFTYDITLLCQLLVQLCHVPFVTTPTDDTLPSDICRIRTFRNTLFGHISQLKLSDTEFKRYWTDIKRVLIRNGSSEVTINTLKDSPLSWKEFEKYKQNIKDSLEQDVACMKTLVETLSNHGDILKTFPEKLSTLEQAVASKDNKTILEEIENLISNSNSNTENQLLLNRQMMDILANSVSSLKEEIKSNSEEIRSNSQSLKTIEEDVKYVKKSLHPPNDSTNISEIKETLNNNKNAFKILLINPPSKMDGDFKMLAESVGCVRWNIIIDTDYKSRTTDGIYDELVHGLTDTIGMDFKPCTYASTKSITAEIKERIAKQISALYILANGCKESDVKSCEDEFGISVTKLTSLLDSIFENFQCKKSFLVCIMVISDQMISQINEIIHMLKNVTESNHETIDTSSSNVIIFKHQSCNISTQILQSWSVKEIECNTRQIERLLGDTISDFQNSNKKHYTFPGQKGPCTITMKEKAAVEGVVELYHVNVGEVDDAELSEDEVGNLIDNEKLSFLKGNELTAHGLFFNDKEQIFVTRKEMKELQKLIKDELDDRQQWKNRSIPFKLGHNASGGGTTSIKFVMYSLRDKYPCLLVLKLTEKLFEITKIIYDQAKLPILLVLDNTEFDEQQVNSVQIRLKNEFIKALVVHVKRCERNQPKNDFFIPSKVGNPIDKTAFDKLYDTKSLKLKLDKVFLFGLLHFCDKYDRLENHIEVCINQCEFIHKKILEIACFVWDYAFLPIKGQLVLRLLGTKDTKGDENVMESLGSASDLLVWHLNDEGIRPAHKCIIEPLLTKLIGTDPHLRLEKFVEHLKTLLEHDREEKVSSTEIFRSVLLQRAEFNETIGLPSEKIYWSKFIQDLQDKCGKPFVESTLQTFISLNSKHETKFLGHCQMLMARYYMYQMEKPIESIAVMRDALALDSPNQSVASSPKKDPVLLNTYGYLIQRELMIKFNEIRQKLRQKRAEKGSTREFIKFAKGKVQEAVLSFQIAQKCPKIIGISSFPLFDARSFIGEARLRLLLLQIYFEIQCKTDHEIFANFIKSTDDAFLKESEYEAGEAIEKLNILMEVNRAHFDSLKITQAHMRKVQFDCLRLRYDHDKDTITKICNTIPENVACDFGGLIRSGDIELNRNVFDKKRKWQDLSVEQLEQIILFIDKRISSDTILRSNFRDILYAMIYIRNINIPPNKGKKLRKYNIEYAELCAKEWVKKYNKDIEAHFMLGILLIVRGLQKNDTLVIDEGVDSLKACRNICNESKTAYHYRMKRFAIGNFKDGLQGVVPHMREDGTMLDKLYKFTGRQVGKRRVKVRGYEMLTCKLDHENDDILAHQERLMSFNIVIAYDNLIAVNFEYDSA